MWAGHNKIGVTLAGGGHAELADHGYRMNLLVGELWEGCRKTVTKKLYLMAIGRQGTRAGGK